MVYTVYRYDREYRVTSSPSSFLFAATWIVAVTPDPPLSGKREEIFSQICRDFDHFFEARERLPVRRSFFFQVRLPPFSLYDWAA